MNRTITGVADAMQHFGVTAADLNRVLVAALEKGGDYADLYFEHSFNNSITLLDGHVNSCSANIDYGMGVRVLCGDQTGYAYVEGTGLEDMLRAARTAARIAQTGTACQPSPIAGRNLAASRYAVLQPWEETAVSRKIPHLERLNEQAFALDRRVCKVQACLLDSTTHVLFCNSLGMAYYDYRPLATFAVTCVMEQDGRVESGNASRSLRLGAEFLTEALVDGLAREVVEKTALLFRAVKPRGGEMPVVMAAGSSGILLHEAIGHAFEADFNRKGISIFSDRLGKQVCHPSISVVDDGMLEHNRGAVNFDDEGVEGQKTYLVHEGILSSYLHDRISARHYGVEPTGNGRRDTFRCPPIPRMRATYMESGRLDEADIVATVDRGIYVDNFTNGQVQIGAGDFTFYVKSGYLIEGGHLTQPIRDINIIGNGPQALADITMVAGNLQIDNSAWTCGKDGQSCPVTCGMPTVLVRRLTVGGE